MVARSRRTAYEKHGESHSLTYTTWESMCSRCHNPADPGYSAYGGSGITVYEPWRLSYLTFKDAVGERPSRGHSLDRFPNKSGNYEPGNCRWATRGEQNRNKRTNHVLTHNGVTKCLTDWAIEKGMVPKTLDDRLRRGWTVADAIEKPVGRAPANKKNVTEGSK